MGNINSNIARLQQIQQFNNQAAEAGFISAGFQAQSARDSAFLNARGTQATLQLQQFSDYAALQSDLGLNRLRSAQLIASKGLEAYTLMEQTREKIQGLLSDIQQSKISNAWQRIKTIASNMKY